MKKQLSDKTYISIFVPVLFLITFLIRLFFIFEISAPEKLGPGPYEDAYNHWRIAYLSKEKGLFNDGFLKLTDLNGMQYFWSFTHPLLTISAFSLSGSTDFSTQRAMTALFGSLSVALIFLICRRFWNTKVALAAAILIALSPLSIFNDSSGMAEPIGIFFLLSSLYFWPKKPLLAGINLALALMSRVENWPLSVFMLGAMIVLSTKTKLKSKLAVLAGYFIPVGFYLFYLYINTGNPVFPLYQNIFVNISGAWKPSYVSIPPPIWIKYIFTAVFLLSVATTVYVSLKKPSGLFLYLLGLGNLMLLGITFGASSFFHAFFPGIIYQRRFLLAWDFLLILASFVLLYKIPAGRKPNNFNKYNLGSILIFIIFVMSQFMWLPVMRNYPLNIELWNNSAKNAKNISGFYTEGGIVVTDAIYPTVFYTLVKYAKIPGGNIINDLTDPYFTMQVEPLENWSEYKTRLHLWVKEKNIKTIVTYTKYNYRYTRLAEEEPDFISMPLFISEGNLSFYRINNNF